MYPIPGMQRVVWLAYPQSNWATPSGTPLVLVFVQGEGMVGGFLKIYLSLQVDPCRREVPTEHPSYCSLFSQHGSYLVGLTWRAARAGRGLRSSRLSFRQRSAERELFFTSRIKNRGEIRDLQYDTFTHFSLTYTVLPYSVALVFCIWFGAYNCGKGCRNRPRAVVVIAPAMTVTSSSLESSSRDRSQQETMTSW